MKQEAVDYLVDIYCWYLATAEGDQPHVRPFSFVDIDGEGKDARIVFCTATPKDVYVQLKANPRFEISGWKPGEGWIVITGRAGMDRVVSPRVRQAGYEHLCGLGESYDGPDDARLTFFSLEDGVAHFDDIDGNTRAIGLDD